MSEPAPKAEINPVETDGLEEIFEATVSEECTQGEQRESAGLAHGEHDGLTLSEAAERFNVSKHTVRRWIKEGRIEASKITGEHGPEWRVYGDQPDQNIESEAVHTVHSNSNEAPYPDMRQLADVIMDLTERLEMASGRASWLECEMRYKKEELKLLPDLQSKASHLMELEQQLQKKNEETEQLHATLQELESELAKHKRPALSRFWDWCMGRSKYQ